MYAVAPKYCILKQSRPKIDRNNEDVKNMKGYSEKLNSNFDLKICKCCLIKSEQVTNINRWFIITKSNFYIYGYDVIK
jgi:hypothetical protein